MNERVDASGLSIDSELYDLVEAEILPGTGIASEQFWHGLRRVVETLGEQNRQHLNRRDELQRSIDAWHKDNQGNFEVARYQSFLTEIGYLVGISEAGDAFQIATENVDAEVAKIAAPQLVVPLDNARYALNAANARWNSLLDALYASDIPDVHAADVSAAAGLEKTAQYNPLRGKWVLQYVHDFLDQAAPLRAGSHADVVCYRVKSARLIAEMADGSATEIKQVQCFAGYNGEPESPTSILLKHHNLHIEICIGEGLLIGKGDLAYVCDVRVESTLTTIMDCEDSVAAVDAADKVRVYRNWAGLMKGDLTATIQKTVDGIKRLRTLQADKEFLDPAGNPIRLSGRSLMFVRNVGTHIYTDAVTFNGDAIAETFLDCMVTALSAIHDLNGNSAFRNSAAGSVYIVKPKMHGAEEVAAAVQLFALTERIFGLAENTLKMGIMDEERRTTVNLKECLRAAKERVVFINTGFLDRTGDEIHTCMEAGAVIAKNDIKAAPWLLAYEDWNVAIGLELGMPECGQIGKGMWAAPAAMAAMMSQHIAHPRAGADTAWVPSPMAATLHVLHYHQIDVVARQRDLAAMRGENRGNNRGENQANLDIILTPSLLKVTAISQAEVVAEIENNAQGILGYVVRWIDQGVGCSKVPDINDIALMEDRATLRISAAHITNWLRHGVTNEAQVLQIFEKMAGVVDRQNSADHDYVAMSADLAANIAFNAAKALVFEGLTLPNGYTETVLHRYRREHKLRYPKIISG